MNDGSGAGDGQGTAVAMISPYRSAYEPEIAFAGDSAMKWYTRRLALALVQAGLPVDIVTTRRDAATGTAFDDDGIRVQPPIDSRPLHFLVGIFRRLKSLPDRIVHVQHELYGYGNLVNAFTLPLVLATARALFGKRVVVTIHGVFPPRAIDRSFTSSNAIRFPVALVRLLWFWITAALCAVSERVQVHEHDQARTLTRFYHCAPGKIVVIPIGIEEHPGALARPATEVLLFFGTISRRKGIVELIAALPAILRARPNSRVVIAGDVPARLRSTLDVRRLLLDAGIEMSRVELFGFVPDHALPDLFAQADVMILPYQISVAASGPLALALGNDVPVLLSNVFAGSFPEAPLLFEPTSVGIQNAVERFFADPQARDDLQQFWANVRRERSWRSVAQALRRVYTALE
ncbi:MAG TPA: glycosyltransferase family 4 protein [Candidatus Acidoferrales bacterium]|nr:glycosyltransferase family 4 protein [Candidatus Acidoferrales bacterium]